MYNLPPKEETFIEYNVNGTDINIDDFKCYSLSPTIDVYSGNVRQLLPLVYDYDISMHKTLHEIADTKIAEGNEYLNNFDIKSNEYYYHILRFSDAICGIKITFNTIIDLDKLKIDLISVALDREIQRLQFIPINNANNKTEIIITDINSQNIINIVGNIICLLKFTYGNDPNDPITVCNGMKIEFDRYDFTASMRRKLARNLENITQLASLKT